MTAADVIRAVAHDYGVTVADLLGRRRSARLVEPRHIATWIARDLLELSFPALARTFHRDASTVQHAVRRATALLEALECSYHGGTVVRTCGPWRLCRPNALLAEASADAAEPF